MTLRDIRDAYDATAIAWDFGPDRVYAALAEALLAQSPVDLDTAVVLDVGAGTGIAGGLAHAAGARRVVALDIAVSMLRRAPATCSPVVADARALPFADSAFDIVIAACALGHLPDPVPALREARRVAPVLLASAFAAGWTHPAKAAVDSALNAVGYRPPAWYEIFKRELEPAVDNATSLRQLATSAGYREVSIEVVEVQTGVRTPAHLVEWRMGMAHLAPFVAGLPAPTREAVRLAAQDALADAPPLVIPLLVVAARGAR